jgi:hypothetical protein
MIRHCFEILRFQQGKKDNVCIVELLEGKGRYYVYVSQGKRTAANVEQIMYTAVEDFDSALASFNSEVEAKFFRGYQFLPEGASIDVPWFAALPGNQKAPKVFKTISSEEHRKLSV